MTLVRFRNLSNASYSSVLVANIPTGSISDIATDVQGPYEVCVEASACACIRNSLQ
jgi:hypothetical protein